MSRSEIRRLKDAAMYIIEHLPAGDWASMSDVELVDNPAAVMAGLLQLINELEGKNG